MTPEQNAVRTVAELMALAARTAPKGKGVDTIIVKILTGKEVKKLSADVERIGTEKNIGFFLRDAKNIADSDACILIGADGSSTVGVNCGACGFATCAGLEAAGRKHARNAGCYKGPNCAIRMADLGIAVGSAVKTAQIHNVDNRIMYSGGVTAVDCGLLGNGCTVAYAVPLSATGKNIFFDRVTGR